MSNDDLDLVFKALANPVRRQICDELLLRPLNTASLCVVFPELDRCTVMQHLNVLERSGLVVPVKRGRERMNYFNAMPIEQMHDRWIGPIAAGAAGRLHRLKNDLEQSESKETLSTPATRR